jgi:hypothetical protein
VEVALEVLDESGRVIRVYSSVADPDFRRYEGGPSPAPKLPAGYGVYRFNWDLHRASIDNVEGLFMLGSYGGGMVPPGTYTLRLTAGEAQAGQTCIVLSDPRLADEVSAADYAEQAAFLRSIEETVTDIHQSVQKMRELRGQFTGLRERLEQLPAESELLEQCQALVDKITAWEEQLVQPEQKTFQDVINFPNRLNAELMNLHSRADTHDPRVTAGAKARLADLLSAWEEMAVERDAILNGDIAAFNRLYQERALPAVFIPSMLEEKGQ